ncbi:MAG: O-antigen ligase family protein [Rhodocyclaceae bacterium]|nr:O-antigen ligase family protein [Rhodocyclaceae bacterium]
MFANSHGQRPLSSLPLAAGDQWCFRGLIAFLFWLPLPLGSNRSFALAILVLFSQLLLWGTIWVWRQRLPELSARLHVFRWPLFFLSCFVAIPWLQCMPLPLSVLQVISPETAAVQLGVVDAYRVTLDLQQTQLYAALSFAYWSVFVVVLVLVRDHARLDTLAFSLVLSGVFQALLGGFLFSISAEYVIFFNEVTHDRVKGAFVYHNSMAGYMEICLSVGIGLMLARLGDGVVVHRSWRARLASFAEFLMSPAMRLRLLLVIMVIALVLTRSRMGNSAFFASLLIVGVIGIVLGRRTAGRTTMLIASLVIIDVFVIGTWVGLEKVVDRLEQTTLVAEAGMSEESVELRQDAANHAWDMVRVFPVLGTGAGSFYNTYLRFRTSRSGYFDHAHNDFAEIAADFGGVGLGILGIFVVLTAGVALRVLVRRRSSLPRGMAFGCLMTIVALAIHSTVDFNLQIPANAMTLMVVLAMAWIAHALPSERVR